ncbi:MAG: DUF1269 domain-containing protein [Chloroflexota bacterium]
MPPNNESQPHEAGGQQQPPVQVIVAGFDSEEGADEAYQTLKALKREKLLTVKDAALLRRDMRNKVHIKELHDMGGVKGAVAGGLIGTSIALLTGPAGLLVTGAVGAAVGGLVAKKRDSGLPNEQLKNLAEILKPGTSMIVAIVEHHWVDDFRDSLGKAGAKVVLAEAFKGGLDEHLAEGKAWYTAYENDRLVLAEPETEDHHLLDFSKVQSTESGVRVTTQVLTKAGLVNREIVVSETGITTQDTPVAKRERGGETAVSLAQLEAEAAHIVETVYDNPESRYKLRLHFYNQHGQGTRTTGFGNSELNFTRWEIRRGVLNPLDDPHQPGSPWWRAVNGHFLYSSTLAYLVVEAGLQDEVMPTAVRYWLDYIRQPSAVTWYRAHNRGIVEGYVQFADIAQDENEYEQFFMNEVLFRVIYASSMVMGKSFGKLGKYMSNPKLPAVDILVSTPHFYPANYPMTFADKMHVLHKGYSLREKAAVVLDEWFVLPKLDDLYQWSAEWLEMPELTRYIIDGQPSYPRTEASS